MYQGGIPSPSGTPTSNRRPSFDLNSFAQHIDPNDPADYSAGYNLPSRSGSAVDDVPAPRLGMSGGTTPGGGMSGGSQPSLMGTAGGDWSTAMHETSASSVAPSAQDPSSGAQYDPPSGAGAPPEEGGGSSSTHQLLHPAPAASRPHEEFSRLNAEFKLQFDVLQKKRAALLAGGRPATGPGILGITQELEQVDEELAEHGRKWAQWRHDYARLSRGRGSERAPPRSAAGRGVARAAPVQYGTSGRTSAGPADVLPDAAAEGAVVPPKVGPEEGGAQDGPPAPAVEETPAAPAVDENAPAGAANGAAVPNDPAAPAPPPPREGWWRRYRVGLILKLMLIMILLEVKLGWFVIYLAAVLFFLFGYFDTMIELARRNNGTTMPLGDQLNALRRNEREVREKREAWEKRQAERRAALEERRRAAAGEGEEGAATAAVGSCAEDGVLRKREGTGSGVVGEDSVGDVAGAATASVDSAEQGSGEHKPAEGSTSASSGGGGLLDGEEVFSIFCKSTAM